MGEGLSGWCVHVFGEGNLCCDHSNFTGCYDCHHSRVEFYSPINFFCLDECRTKLSGTVMVANLGHHKNILYSGQPTTGPPIPAGHSGELCMHVWGAF